MIQRLFIPGSPWLYFKIYTGHKTADDLLTEKLYPYVKELRASGLIDGHFFIRYSDPEFHLRFRVHIPQPENYGEVFRRFYGLLEPCIENGQVFKVMCDTYNREVERYGEDTMELLECLFHFDSEAMMALLSHITLLPAEVKEQIRWQIVLLLLDDTLTAFGYELSDKMRLLKYMDHTYKKEFGFTSHTYTKQLNEKFRTIRTDIEHLLSRTEPSAYNEILQVRRNRITKIASEIKILRTKSADIDNMLSSIQHMTMNRWFRSYNRMHELVIYDFLNKYYESAYARMQCDIQNN